MDIVDELQYIAMKLDNLEGEGRGDADKCRKAAAEIESLRAELAEARKPDMFWDVENTDNTLPTSLEEYADYDDPVTKPEHGQKITYEFQVARSFENIAVEYQFDSEKDSWVMLTAMQEGK